MRWPFGPPHLSLKPSKKTKNQKKQKNKTREKKQEKKKKKKYPKMSFQCQPKFLRCGGGPKFPFLDNLAKKRGPKKHYKHRVSASIFWKTDVRHETAIFGPHKTKTRNSSYHFWGLFLLFQQQKHKNVLKALLYSVLANLEKRFFKS